MCILHSFFKNKIKLSHESPSEKQFMVEVGVVDRGLLFHLQEGI